MTAVLNPATEETIAEVPAASTDETDAVVAAARAAYPDWRAVTPGDRARLLRRLSALAEECVSCATDTPEDEVAALFDKYNLITLAVVDEHGRIAGIITADDVISMLRQRK